MDSGDERLTEIRDLLAEMRDMQREQREDYKRFAGTSLERQATAVRIQKVAMIVGAGVIILVVFGGVLLIASLLGR
jgi:CHASE3 domain sensor protein